MTMKDQKLAAEAFVAYWTAQRGSEKGEDQTFWNSLLGEVLGVSDVKSRIKYQEPVYFNDGSTKFLDAWIPETQVLIEHKSRGIDLDAPQAGHRGQTPFEQVWDYDNNRPRRERARWIVISNFDEIRIHDMEADRPAITYQTILLKDLAKEVNRLSFLVTEVESIRDKEARVSVEAGRVVGKLYSALLDDLIASGILPSPLTSQTSHTSHTSQTSQTFQTLSTSTSSASGSSSASTPRMRASSARISSSTSSGSSSRRRSTCSSANSSRCCRSVSMSAVRCCRTS